MEDGTSAQGSAKDCASLVRGLQILEDLQEAESAEQGCGGPRKSRFGEEAGWGRRLENGMGWGHWLPEFVGTYRIGGGQEKQASSMFNYCF